MINIMLADDSYLIRAGIVKLLSLDKEINIVGDYDNGADLVDSLRKNSKVDVVLLDIDMPIMNGIQTATLLREEFPMIKIVILTVFNDDKNIFSSLNLRVDGYLLKDCNSDILIATIHEVVKNGMVYAPPVLAKILNNYQPSSACSDDTALGSLTERERTIAELIHQGCSNQDIADRLFLAVGTVKNDVSSIFKKLGIKRRTQLNSFFK